MKLAEALELVNLPDLISTLAGPDAVRGLHRERGGVICDPRPGFTERRASFSVYRVGQVGRWKRHGGDEAGGSAYDLLPFFGYSDTAAREEVYRLAGVAPNAWTPGRGRPVPVVPDPLADARAALARCAPFSGREKARALSLLAALRPEDGAGHDLAARGLLGWDGLHAGKLRRDFATPDGRLLARAGSPAIFMRGPDGAAWGLKVRNLGRKEALDAAGLLRYVYRIAGHGAPAWCSPGYGTGGAVLLVEGELNGAAAARGLAAVGASVDVQGLAGAGGTPYLDGLAGRSVYLYADPDTAGAACVARLGKLARAAGAREVRALTSLPSGDFCDLAGELGAAELGGRLMGWMRDADYWQNANCSKNGLPVNNAVQDGEKHLWQTGSYISGWGGSDASGWGTDAGGWGQADRGGW